MRQNRMLHRLRQGQVAVCPVLVYDSPDLAEQVAHLDFDGVFLDGQHGAWTEATLLNVLARFLATDCTPLVRVKTAEPGAVNFMLDMGALGIVVPMVQDGDQARQAASGAFYPPLGRRSSGGSRLALIGGAGWEDYFARANGEVLLVAMVETEAAIVGIDDILATPGLGAVLVGPSDLALDLQASGRSEADQERLLGGLVAAAQRAGVAAGYVCGTPAAAQRRITQGFRLIVYGSDAGVVDAGFRALRAESRDW